MEPFSTPQVPQHVFYCKTWPPRPIEVPFNYKNKTDEELLSYLKKGNAQQRDNAFNAIYNRYQSDVANYSSACMDTEEKAKDLFADVWGDFSKTREKFEWREKPIRNWLIKVAKNKSVKQNEKLQKRKKCEVHRDDIETLMELDPSKEVENPIDSLLRKESDKRVMFAISKLQNKLQKKILIAIYMNGITSSQELAKMFGTTPTNIRVNHHRALKILKKSEEIKKLFSD